MGSKLKGTIHRQRETIARTLHEPLARIAGAWRHGAIERNSTPS